MPQFEPHAEYTDAELLDLVKAAIATVVVAGQSYEIRGKVYTRADLEDLWNIRTKLETLVNAGSTSKRAVNVVKFVRPSSSSE